MRNLISVFVPCLLALPPATASVSIISGEVDVVATSTAGKAGSTSGVITDDPPVLNGTSGIVALSAIAVAGPVPAGEIPTLPGTTGVATASAAATIDFTQAGLIPTSVSADSTFVNMDDGIYAANEQSTLSVTFSVPVDTPYTATGSFNVDPGDVIWQYRLIGTGGFLVNNATEAGDAGPINESGILLAGETYTLSSRVALNKTLSAVGNDAFSSAISAVLEIETVCTAACDVPGGDADVDDDCDVDLSDLAGLLANFGSTTAGHADGDTDFDGDVDLTDLANLLALFGTDCQ